MRQTEYRADFHTHTLASDDGGLKTGHIEAMLGSGSLWVVGITDHDTIGPETRILAEHYPGHVIIGEEVTTLDHGKKSA
jgi:predicted metal-dependent phosphoesterase TrpH